MIRIVTFLCLATSAFGGLLQKEKDTTFTKNLRVTFSINPLDYAFKKAFTEQPMSKAAAVDQDWIEVSSPDSHKEFSSLVLLCPNNDYTLCLFFDDTGYVAGLQIAFDIEQYTNSIYDWKTQGFTYWTVVINGKSEDYWTTAMYFSSPEYLQTSADTRIASRDATKLLQDKYLYVSGINGQLHPIPTDVTELANSASSNFTEQACMLMMGHHYYYKMTTDLPCNDEMFPFFPLVYSGQLIGVGFSSYGQYKAKKGRKDVFERPDQAAVKLIVPRGPECLYELAKKPGLVTMHTYFVNKPIDITCL